MPSKVQQKKHASNKLKKKSEDAVALFRREVEEQERLVEALKSHQQDRTDRIERIKSLLASGSELASAVGVWENPTNNKKVRPTKDGSGDASALHSDPNAALPPTTDDNDAATVPAVSNGDDKGVAIANDDDDDDDECGDISTSARVSEIKGLAADMMQAVMEEFGGYMAGMEQHRAVLEGLKGTSPTTTTTTTTSSIGVAVVPGAADVAVGDVDAEEEAALQELVEFRQRMKDNKKKRQRSKKKNKVRGAVTASKDAVDGGGDVPPATTPHQPSSSSPSHDAQLYLSLLDRLTSSGGALAPSTEGEGGSAPPPSDAVSNNNNSNEDVSPDWLMEAFEPAAANISSTVVTKGGILSAVDATAAVPHQQCHEDDEGSYSDDFEGDE